MLHACLQKFNVTGNLEIFWKLNRARIASTLELKQMHQIYVSNAGLIFPRDGAGKSFPEDASRVPTGGKIGGSTAPYRHRQPRRSCAAAGTNAQVASSSPRQDRTSPTTTNSGRRGVNSAGRGLPACPPFVQAAARQCTD